jgi:hypothetical protein
MILNRAYLRQQVAGGVAREIGLAKHELCEYVIVDRLDRNTTDHYLATDADVARVHSLDRLKGAQNE